MILYIVHIMVHRPCPAQEMSKAAGGTRVFFDLNDMRKLLGRKKQKKR